MYDIPEKKDGEQILVYKETPTKRIELIFRAPTKKVYDKAPVFLVIPGGGWRGESKTDMLTMVPQSSETLRSLGWAIVSIDYRVIKEGATAKGMLSDCSDACRYLAHFADELGIDRNKFAICGHSAGGHLALELCLTPHTFFTEDSPFDAYKDDYTVLGCAPMSPATFMKRYCDESYSNWILFENIFDNDEKTAENAELFSPINFLTPLSVPILLMYGSHDTCVSPANSILFLQRAKLVGAKVTPVCSENGDHCFESFRAPAESHPNLTEMQPILADWVNNLLK